MDYGDANVPQRSTSVDAQFQHHVAVGAHNDVIWGLEYNGTVSDIPPTAVFQVLPSHADRKMGAIFAEDEITLIPDRLRFIAGVRTSYDTATQFQIQPTGRLLWTPTGKLTTSAAVSRAVHAPSVRDTGFNATVAAVPWRDRCLPWCSSRATRACGRKSALSYEAGDRIQVSRSVSFDASAFYTVHQHLQGADTLAPYFVPPSATQIVHLVFPQMLTNIRYGASEGYDLSTNWNVNPRWRLTAGRNWQRIHTHAYPGIDASDTVTDGGTTPHDQYQFRSSID